MISAEYPKLTLEDNLRRVYLVEHTASSGIEEEPVMKPRDVAAKGQAAELPIKSIAILMVGAFSLLCCMLSTVPLFAAVDAPSKYSLQFTRSNGQYAGTDSTLTLTEYGELTIEAWIKVDSFQPDASPPHYGISTIAGEETATHSFLLRLMKIGEENRLQFVMRSASVEVSITGNTDLATGTWYHVAGTYGPEPGFTLRLYLNGVEDATAVANSSWTNMGTLNDTFHIGRSLGDRYFDGQIDEVRLWTARRTAEEIRANIYRELAGSESNLLAYYRMGDGSGTTLTDDTSASAHDSTLHGSPSTVSWTVSGAFSGPRNRLDFDGSDDYVSIPSNGLLNNSTFSVEFWMKMNDTPGNWDGIVDKGRYAGSPDWFFICIHPSWGRGGIFGMPGTELWFGIPDNEWHHVAGTYDGTTATLYLDGKLASSSTVSYTPTSNGIHLGRTLGSYNYCFNGGLDELRVWSDTRTAREIRDNMCRTLRGDESGLVACYRFDQAPASGQTTLYDLTGNGINGTLTNMDSTTDRVASTAFNTWEGSVSAAWSAAANWSRSAIPGSTDSVGLHAWTGGSGAAISGSPTVNHLMVAADAGTTLGSGLTVNGSLVLEQDLDLSGQTITLGADGTLVEDAGRLYGASGSITTTRSLNAPSAENVGGLGAQLTTGVNLGSTVITREHAAVSSESGLQKSIFRSYEITPTTNSGLNATLRFTYDEDELNAIPEGDLALYRWNDGQSRWECNGLNQSRDTSDNWVQQTGIDAFSTWTLGDADDPTLVDLVSFTTGGLENAVVLEWETASEIDTAGFNILRRAEPGDAYTRITDVLIPSVGGPAWGASYLFEDDEVTPGRVYTYLLQDVDFQGQTDEHGPVSAWAGLVRIEANGSEGPVAVSAGQAVSVTVRVQPCGNKGLPVECWIGAQTPFGWYSYAGGWKPGIRPAGTFRLTERKEKDVLGTTLPPGAYTFHLVLDDRLDGRPELLWADTVTVTVE